MVIGSFPYNIKHLEGAVVVIWRCMEMKLSIIRVVSAHVLTVSVILVGLKTNTVLGLLSSRCGG